MPERTKNVRKDPPDLRDRMYEPALAKLPPEVEPDTTRDQILDQLSEGACTGFALAAVINRLAQNQSGSKPAVSPRMLYEMAKRFDEWEGEDYSGSSIRGAIRGWKNSGVCLEDSWKYRENRPGTLTIDRAKEARSCTVGAYYRLRPEVSEYHAALNETGVIATTATVHSGWDAPREVIRFNKRPSGGHAFAIVGYNSKGFWIQNSWGPDWGSNGMALWTYEDWIHNVMDAWVVQLALPTPQIFGMKAQTSIVAETEAAKKPKATRAEIAGHFVHVDDGRFKEQGRYWSTNADVKQTATYIAKSVKYDHLLVYAHGGLNAPVDAARRIHSLRDGFKRNGIYPYHVMYDTGLTEELKDVIFRRGRQAEARVGGFKDWLDDRIEATTRRFGTKIWDEIKNDALIAFRPSGAGTRALQHFIRELRKPEAHAKKIHLVGHSTGGVLIAHLLNALADDAIQIDSCTLFAPACSIDLYNEIYMPVLQGKTKISLSRLQILNLNDNLEQDDEVMGMYQKSLLYLVSNAFEKLEEGQTAKPLLGMQKYSRDIDTAGGKTTCVYSDGFTGSVTHSRSHGGFDNDLATMNHVLRSVLGKKPSAPFRPDELDY